MEQKIKARYEKEFASSPLAVTDEEIAFIIRHDCSCDDCGTSIFEMRDHPHIDIAAEELLCEDCYHDEYETNCPYCENTVRNEDIQEEYFVINEDGAVETGLQVGFHKALETPCFKSGFFGFEYIIENSTEFVKAFPKSSPDCQETGFICTECVEKEIPRTL